MEETLERLGASPSIAELAKMSEERRKSSKLLESGSLDVHKNAATSIMAMLGHLELGVEVSDTGMETTESNDCREMFRKNRDANGVLAMT